MRVAMGRANFATLMLYAVLASALAGSSGGIPLRQSTPRLKPMPFPLPPPLPLQPLCASQFSLVNHACSMIMPTPAPPLAPPSPPPSPPSPSHPRPRPPCHDDSRHGYEDHHHHYCHKHRHRHVHHHRRRHGQRGAKPSPAEQDCCKWLKEVDSECVCDLLVHLPSFLARPIHEYTVIVANSCNVTYSCGGRLKP